MESNTVANISLGIRCGWAVVGTWRCEWWGFCGAGLEKYALSPHNCFYFTWWSFIVFVIKFKIDMMIRTFSSIIFLTSNFDIENYSFLHNYLPKYIYCF